MKYFSPSIHSTKWKEIEKSIKLQIDMKQNKHKYDPSSKQTMIEI